MPDQSHVGRRYGPFRHQVVRGRVSWFVAATGAPDAGGEVPPMYASLYCIGPVMAALFADGEVGIPHDGVIHSEQSLEWQASPRVGDILEARGEIVGIQDRRRLVLVTLELEAANENGSRVCAGRTVLLQRAAS